MDKSKKQAVKLPKNLTKEQVQKVQKKVTKGPKQVVKKVGKGLSKMTKPLLYSTLGIAGAASGLAVGVSATVCVVGTLGVVSIVSGVEVIVEHKINKNKSKKFEE